MTQVALDRSESAWLPDEPGSPGPSAWSVTPRALRRANAASWPLCLWPWSDRAGSYVQSSCTLRAWGLPY